MRYTGSDDDAALNAALDAKGLRFQADPKAAAAFAADADHAGKFRVPVISSNGIRDSTVFVEGSDTLRQRMELAGNGARLVQTFVNSGDHSYFGDAMYPPLFDALLAWVEQGVKPTAQGIADRCRAQQAGNPAACLFVPEYVPKALSTRIAPR